MKSDVKPDNILINHSPNENRFSDVKLADCGDSTHVDSVTEEHVIGATISEALKRCSILSGVHLWIFGL